ncbi:uncharacterized protein LOC143452685 [Clavelina lepadiformis]|uniref:uncharacterized protein LOC143452685 n=1 Tax=Clavelina lepadiformis TaxID=159417 RepID=UPI00404144BF
MELSYFLPVLVMMLSFADNGIAQELSGRCYGDIHVDQYDGAKFMDQTPGTYVCSKTVDGFADNAKAFELQVTTVAATRRGKVISVISSVSLTYGGVVFDFSRPTTAASFTITPADFSSSALANNQQTHTADDGSYVLTYNNGKFELTVAGGTFKMTFNGRDCKLTTDATTYSGQLEGLLGNRDGVGGNDQKLRNTNTQATSTEEFVQSWKE